MNVVPETNPVQLFLEIVPSPQVDIAPSSLLNTLHTKWRVTYYGLKIKREQKETTKRF